MNKKYFPRENKFDFAYKQNLQCWNFTCTRYFKETDQVSPGYKDFKMSKKIGKVKAQMRKDAD